MPRSSLPRVTTRRSLGRFIQERRRISEVQWQVLQKLYKPKHARILIWDLETTDLMGDFGFLLCLGYKYLGERSAHVVSILDYAKTCSKCHALRDATNDHKLLLHAYGVLTGADMWVTWNGKNFDERFFNTRLLEHHLSPMPSIPHWDGKAISWRHFRQRNSLANVSEVLGLDEKTPLEKKIWRKAGAGDKKCLRYVIQHCKQDVYTLEQAYLYIRPFTRMHPTMGVIEGAKYDKMCPICGSPNLRRCANSYHLSRVTRRPRFQCRDCTGWSYGGLTLQKAEIR